MDIDTAVRHKIPVVCVISNNGGWTADAPWTRPLPKPGRNLGFTRYDRMAMELGAHGEYVEKPHDIRPALERAFAVRQAGRRQRHHRPQGARARPCASPRTRLKWTRRPREWPSQVGAVLREAGPRHQSRGAVAASVTASVTPRAPTRGVLAKPATPLGTGAREGPRVAPTPISRPGSGCWSRPSRRASASAALQTAKALGRARDRHLRLRREAGPAREARPRRRHPDAERRFPRRGA